MTLFNPLPSLPNPRPFRVGVTSYIFPADILPNVEALSGNVDDVELLLFESENVSNLPSPEVFARLAELGRRNNMTYTVHLPFDRALGSPDTTERTAHRKQIERILRLTKELPVHGYILHLEGVKPGDSAERVQVWQRDVAVELRQLFAVPDMPAPDQFCVESLSYPFAWCDPLLDEFGLSVCMDVGHLWRYGASVPDFIQRYLPRTRVVHFHGERDGKDHQPLTALTPERMQLCLQALRYFPGVVTLEVFEYDAARLSLERLTEWLENEKHD
ncbi:MAG: sugar phosphate isomerase/epimerase [Verrucomicrobia bacterium]|nr:MAG: sugar phosphate isomerase/epimerase [Verrucomicrobiota bacterium]